MGGEGEGESNKPAVRGQQGGSPRARKGCDVSRGRKGGRRGTSRSSGTRVLIPFSANAGCCLQSLPRSEAQFPPWVEIVKSGNRRKVLEFQEP